MMPPVMGSGAASTVHTILDSQTRQDSPVRVTPRAPMHVCLPPSSNLPVTRAPAQPTPPRLPASHSPCGHGVTLRLKDTVLARHTDPLDILCSDPQIGPKDGDPDAAAQRARLRMDLELVERS